jgi:hypothetical protein
LYSNQAARGAPYPSSFGERRHMRLRLLLLAATALPLLSEAVPAAAQLRSAPAPDPVGTFDIAFTNHGHGEPAVVTLSKQSDGQLVGSLEVHGQTMTFTTVTYKNRELTLTVRAEGGDLTLKLSFKTADRLEGSYETAAMGSGSLTGARRKS